MQQSVDKKPFFRHPLFWTIFIAISLAAGAFSYYYFSVVLPFVNLTISMNRKEALTAARALAEKYSLGPTHSRAAAYFNSDCETQNYIELERGGAAAWNNFINEKVYYPYTWIVRHFKQGDTNEAYFSFTPDGTRYGFVEIVAESAPGEALTAQEARARIERFLLDEWHIPLPLYELKDSKKITRPQGRTDHTFVFERKIKNLGNAHYLLTVVLTGDKITTITHLIDIPQEFTRSFKNARSFNETIHYFAKVIMYLLYLIAGCLGGILFLLKKQWLLPRQAIIAGIA